MIDKITMLGDFYALDMWTPPHEVLTDIERFKDSWSQYNSFKPDIPRQGLCIINEDGVNKQGPALDSLLEWNKRYNTNYNELDFNVSTPVYNETMLKDERKRIEEVTSCSYLEDLITCVHVIQLKALTCVRVGQKQKKIDIDVPSTNSFIHKCYIIFSTSILNR